LFTGKSNKYYSSNEKLKCLLDKLSPKKRPIVPRMGLLGE